ncbi:hypothetical protein EXIGLDRAFT_725209 [Exidia glandulosa HHB12029]|uniref:Uncharacterized protein n=1 Tax=Exidia glandulosa HHB12029 TaxID=1314781 RepID=A0A165E3Y7_EXIGL|nr:hypothetical protein EXIGLDRAFT_725209 [Exidia glandulosa HHB12029]
MGKDRLARDRLARDHSLGVNPNEAIRMHRNRITLEYGAGRGTGCMLLLSSEIKHQDMGLRQFGNLLRWRLHKVYSTVLLV